MKIKEIDSLQLCYEEDVDGIMFVKLQGYIDTYNSHAFLLEVLNSAVQKGFYKLIFECSALTFVSSTGIGTFVEILKYVREKGGGIAFYSLYPKIEEIFQLLGFNQFFLIGRNKKEAVEKLNNKISKTLIENKETECPVCGKPITLTRPGRFRCTNCKSIINVNDDLVISL